MATKKQKINAPAMCQAIGGDFDFDDETCDIKMDTPEFPRSITRSGLIFYFVLQVLIGSSIVVIGVFYSVTLIPVAWWSSYIILGIVFLLAIAMIWYKVRSWWEAILRALVSLGTIAGFAVLIGTIYFWDLTLYWSLEGFAQDPIYSTISGMIVSALLSVILVPPAERQDSGGNDMSWGIVK